MNLIRLILDRREDGVIEMPELPEVETIVRGLRDVLCGKTIAGVEIREEMIIGYPEDPEEFREGLLERKITAMGRRGKYLILELNSNLQLIIHLRMTGKLLLKMREEEIESHTHVILRFKEGVDLRFNNVRKFGRMYLIDRDSPEKAGGFAGLGPEPLSSEFSPEVFRKILKRSGRAIKALLLDQKKIAGLGNIYADEALYRASIHPARPADELSREEMDKLYQSIDQVLKAGIKFSGTSFSDYVNALGEAGSFQERLMVYGRDGEKCPRCSCQINKDRIASRSTHYCPECQELP